MKKGEVSSYGLPFVSSDLRFGDGKVDNEALAVSGWITKQDCLGVFCEELSNAAQPTTRPDPWPPRASWNSACS